MAAAQALDFASSSSVVEWRRRAKSCGGTWPTLEEDRPLYPDHNRMKELVRSGEILEAVEAAVGPLA